MIRSEFADSSDVPRLFARASARVAMERWKLEIVDGTSGVVAARLRRSFATKVIRSA